MWDLWKKTALVRLFGWTKVPLIGVVRPKVIEINNNKAVIQIPLGYWTKNHLGSMYFGALAIGADLCAGLLAIHHSETASPKPKLVFKSFSIDFLKRPQSAVFFQCEDGLLVQKMVHDSVQTRERVTEVLRGIAFTESVNDPVAEFKIELSLKV